MCRSLYGCSLIQVRLYSSHIPPDNLIGFRSCGCRSGPAATLWIPCLFTVLLLFGDGFPKRGKRFILKLAYRKFDTSHGCRTHVIVGAGAFNAGDKADVAFIIAGRGVKECGKLPGSLKCSARLIFLS